MTSFSERFGFVPAPTDLPQNQMPASLRNGLWDAIRVNFLKIAAFSHGHYMAHESYERKLKLVANHVWFAFFKEPLDTRPTSAGQIIAKIRSAFFAMSFNSVYDFAEFLAAAPNKSQDFPVTDSRRFCSLANHVLERELAAFRFAGQVLVRVSDPITLQSIEDAMGQEVDGVRIHIRRAAELYSQRPNPDYRNSIKEAISAVESAVSFVTGGRPDGVSKPLRKAFEQSPIHPALRDGFEKLYAYTSDAEGIRHALLEESNLTQEDARYMLAACSAFANYLVAMSSRK